VAPPTPGSGWTRAPPQAIALFVFSRGIACGYGSGSGIRDRAEGVGHTCTAAGWSPTGSSASIVVSFLFACMRLVFGATRARVARSRWRGERRAALRLHLFSRYRCGTRVGGSVPRRRPGLCRPPPPPSRKRRGARWRACGTPAPPPLPPRMCGGGEGAAPPMPPDAGRPKPRTARRRHGPRSSCTSPLGLLPSPDMDQTIVSADQSLICVPPTLTRTPSSHRHCRDFQTLSSCRHHCISTLRGGWPTTFGEKHMAAHSRQPRRPG